MDLMMRPVAELVNQASSWSWGPLVHLARNTILSLLSKIDKGSLKITDCNGRVTLCGAPQIDGAAKRKGFAPFTELQVHKDTFWVRMLLFADMGFAESYLLGEVSCPDLTAFFEIFILNRNHLSNGTTLTSSLSSAIAGLARRTNTLANARLNIAAHYDISNDMFAAFLSPDMTYSCPIWAPTPPMTKSTPMIEESLESAQERKLRFFIDAAHLKPTDRVLEIGTGWGSFAIAAVKATDCHVTSLTLSVEQKELAEQRIAAAGYSDKIEVLLCDYRALPVPDSGPYDKVISIEMLEAVGREYLDTYFACVDRLLKPDGGIAVFQCITMPENRYEAYHKSTDFIRSYIFPGGHLPTPTLLFDSISAGSKNRLLPQSITNIGAHYSKTLRLWREQFRENFDAKIRPSLLSGKDGEANSMTDGEVEVFRRKWEYYFTYCEAGFRTCTLGDVIFVAAREGCVELAEEVPL
ncbi:MAG: hypothetical protein M1828_003404 [Chrysothrix sp. TS-e1954]|nr:MAG: hypothetical protein M1828_003404 [Chrysothrix sp. TS-e1954]